MHGQPNIKIIKVRKQARMRQRQYVVSIEAMRKI